MDELRQNCKMLKYSMDIFCRRKYASNSSQSIVVKGQNMRCSFKIAENFRREHVVQTFLS